MNVTSDFDIFGNESSNSSNGLDCGGGSYSYAVWEQVIIVIVAVFLSSTTVVGNIMVMVSFKIDKQLQTISNYFLFSLAIADFLIGLISMPLFTLYTVLGYWPLGPRICDTWLALDYCASNASVLNLLIISFDRYLSVTRPLTYRAKRTTKKAAFMIAGAWGISMLLWPPWIYAWPYIEGQRTVPYNACYIQFIETNHYITFITAIAAFYVPVSVMITLYWRIWKETKQRQKDLPYLQAGKPDASKRSNSSDEALDMEDCRRPRSESSTAVEDMNSTHIAVSYLEKHYPQYKGKHRPFSWMWLKMWCIAWWHSGREDDDEEEEIEGAESSRTGHGYDTEAITPLSAETPLTGTVSRSASLSGIHPTTITVDKTLRSIADIQEYKNSGKPGDLSTKSISTDSVYTILIRLPTRDSSGVGKLTEGPSIKMYHDEAVTFQLHSMIEEENGKIFRLGGTLSSPSPVIRRPSHMPDIRIPLNTKTIPRALAGKGHGSTGATAANKAAANKKKKKQPEKKGERKAAKTLSAILFAFIITWLPYNIFVLIKSITDCSWHIPQKLWDFSYYLCYINSTVNPMCYALCNAAFRRTYVRILKCKWQNRNRTAVDKG